ncbi:hypothetical protein SAMN05421640_0856 [Ekhidna lutea]|uniref:Outer membrane protein beta-barrel domain-containing protein n=1 Tax=Ekhidna lutea TaxID=447679 RepID=A0A239GL62_EKHLU|nr:hypothetical protein [Ekhidna lutea]SNS68804.1 hypothetical protein SAMN05421640_0856 [Ekhidna lutea]
MKYTLIFLLAISMAGAAQAQESDTTKTENKPAVSDTIPNSAQKQTSKEDDTPKIIYYQSTEDNSRDHKRKRRQDIKTLSGSMSHSGGFGALSFRSTEFRNESLVLAGLRGGWIINRTLGIGVEGHGIIPTAKFDDIEAGREVNILGGYGGMFLELIFFSNEVVHVTFPVSGGAGWLGYHRTSEDVTMPGPIDQEVDGDVFWYLEPGADLEFNVSRNFRLALGASKRFTQDLELVNTKSNAFDKLNYFITLKVGGF